LNFDDTLQYYVAKKLGVNASVSFVRLASRENDSGIVWFRLKFFNCGPRRDRLVA